MILQRLNEFFKDVSLEFFVGAAVTFTLSNVKAWETIELAENSIFTDYVKITGINVHNKMHNGFAELKVFGCASGMVTHFEWIDVFNVRILVISFWNNNIDFSNKYLR